MRQTVPGSAGPRSPQLGEPVSGSQTIEPTAQGLPGSVQTSPATQGPQTGPEQKPSAHSVPSSAKASSGQKGDSPSQTSAGSHSPVDAREYIGKVALGTPPEA